MTLTFQYADLTEDELRLPFYTPQTGRRKMLMTF